MITSLIIGITGMTTLMILWLIVQRQWGKSFYDQNNHDVLADRSTCGNCGCITYCEDKEPRNK